MRATLLLIVAMGAPQPATTLVDLSGTELAQRLERNAYGPEGRAALIGLTAAGPVFRPATSQDHLATPFAPLPYKLLRQPVVTLTVEGLSPGSPLTIRLQRQDYSDIGPCEPNCSVAAGWNGRAVRVVILSKGEAILPQHLKITVTYRWQTALIGTLVPLAFVLGCFVAGIVVYPRPGSWARRLVNRTARWSDRFASARHGCTTATGYRHYWAWASILLAAYALLWAFHWPYIYGWRHDDWGTFLKAKATLADPRNAFIVRANLLQPYFFLFSYLPLALGLRVPSVEIPTFGIDTSLFRGLIFYATFYHVGIGLVWAWIARKICWHDSAALLSLALLLASPSFVLWTPQVDSRLVGLPLVLWGIWLLIRVPVPGPREAFWAGLLFALGYNLHYTAMYLALPCAILVCALDLLGRWHHRTYWQTWFSFAAGAGVIVVLLELLSHFWAGQPFSAGPLHNAIFQAEIHASAVSRWDNLRLWKTFILDLIGWPLVVLMVIGMAVYARHRRQPGIDRHARVALLLAQLLGLGIVLFSGSVPFFRQTSVLQPFFFLFAAISIIEISACVKQRVGRVMLAGALFIAAGTIPVLRAYEVFEAHLGFGKVLQWVTKNRGNRRIGWLIPHAAEYTPAEYLNLFAPDDWIIMQTSMYAPALRNPLEGVRPLQSAPGLWGTHAVYAETFGSNHSDFRGDLFLTGAHVYRVGDLRNALRGHWQPALPVVVPLVLNRVEAFPEEDLALAGKRLLRYFRPVPDTVPIPKVLVTGAGFSPYSVLVWNGVTLPTRIDDFREQGPWGTTCRFLIAALPADVRGCSDTFVQDGERRSNMLRACLQ